MRDDWRVEWNVKKAAGLALLGAETETDMRVWFVEIEGLRGVSVPMGVRTRSCKECG